MPINRDKLNYRFGYFYFGRSSDGFSSASTCFNFVNESVFYDKIRKCDLSLEDKLDILKNNDDLPQIYQPIISL